MRPEIMEGILAHITDVCGKGEIKILEISPGHALVSVEVLPESINMYGSIHGGFLFTLCDTVAGMSTYAYEVSNVSQSSSIQYLRGSSTGTLYVEANAIHKGRRTVVTQVTIKDEQDRLLVNSTFSMFITGTV